MQPKGWDMTTNRPHLCQRNCTNREKIPICSEIHNQPHQISFDKFIQKAHYLSIRIQPRSTIPNLRKHAVRFITITHETQHIPFSAVLISADPRRPPPSAVNGIHVCNIQSLRPVSNINGRLQDSAANFNKCRYTSTIIDFKHVTHHCVMTFTYSSQDPRTATQVKESILSYHKVWSALLYQPQPTADTFTGILSWMHRYVVLNKDNLVRVWASTSNHSLPCLTSWQHRASTRKKP